MHLKLLSETPIIILLASADLHLLYITQTHIPKHTMSSGNPILIKSYKFCLII